MKGYEGTVFHTPENGSPTLAAAIATVRWQATDKNTSGGSYHGILGFDESKGLPMSDRRAWVLAKSVHFGQIAGSISTRRDDIWHPERYAVLQLLSDAAYADPNAYLHALCLGGNAAWWSDKLATPDGRAEVRGALVRLAQWVLHLERLYDYDSVLNLHRMWQTNRSDPGPILFTEYVMDEYEKIVAARDDDPTKEELTASVASLTDQVKHLQAQRNRLRSRLDAKDASFAALIAEAQKGAAA